MLAEAEEKAEARGREARKRLSIITLPNAVESRRRCWQEMRKRCDELETALAKLQAETRRLPLSRCILLAKWWETARFRASACAFICFVCARADVSFCWCDIGMPECMVLSYPTRPKAGKGPTGLSLCRPRSVRSHTTQQSLKLSASSTRRCRGRHQPHQT